MGNQRIRNGAFISKIVSAGKSGPGLSEPIRIGFRNLCKPARGKTAIYFSSTGQKIWTSKAQIGRTGGSSSCRRVETREPKIAAISYLLVTMKTRGTQRASSVPAG